MGASLRDRAGRPTDQAPAGLGDVATIPSAARVPNACDCHCHKCQGACEHKPGWFKPDDIAPLAAALGLSEKALFDQYLQVDWWDGDSDTDYADVFVLSPAVVGGDAGDMFDRDPRGRCVWFQSGKCAIHEAGKPFECAAYHHSDPDKPPHHREAALAWHRPEHQEKVRALLGREPAPTGDWSIFDEMGLGGFYA